MPNLKFDERMQRCEFEEHDEYKSQKYYIVRRYASELERHMCFGCLCIMQRQGHVRLDRDGGFVPVSSTVERLLNIYGINGYYKTYNPPKIRRNKETNRWEITDDSESDLDTLDFVEYEEAVKYLKENMKWNSKTKSWL